ncbi:unnamed protein product, partial [Prorocentrum cordatum]
RATPSRTGWAPPWAAAVAPRAAAPLARRTPEATALTSARKMMGKEWKRAQDEDRRRIFRSVPRWCRGAPRRRVARMGPRRAAGVLLVEFADHFAASSARRGVAQLPPLPLRALGSPRPLGASALSEEEE